MVKIENVNKYFYRFKKNQIHVINNADIQFENKGLVAILGNSGCGKTTLLNCIGGLDKVNKGKIYINGKKITKRFSSKIDKIRAINIGYIFQNYNLINNLTVFENVALALKISGIKNKEEIKTRVDYILETLGIYKYRNRFANMLSGGEKQRVAIARAIAKNSNIIIADEPTGNLDSKNSLEIMNIIKSISKDKLVILVTHEKDLAKFYASRIIEIVDGKIISDKSNEHVDDLDYRLENKIYLKDLSNHNNLKKENFNIDIYSDNEEEKNKDIDVKIVLKNGNLYIKANNKTEIIEENSSLELIDDHYKKISKEEANMYKFDYEKIINNKYKIKYTSIYNPITLITNGFKTIYNYSVLKKMLLLGFIASSMFVLYGISNIFGTLDIKDEKFVEKNANYLEITTANIDVDKYLEYENLENINYIMPGNSKVNFYLKYNDYYQTQYAQDSFEASLSGVELINNTDLIYGRMPENDYEIVLDKLILSKMLNTDYSNAKQVGILNIENYIDRKISIGQANYGDTKDPIIDDMKIVGIVDLHSPCVYINNNMFINILAENQSNNNNFFGMNQNSSSTKLIDIELAEDIIQITKGRMPENDYEIIVNESNSSIMKLNKTIDEQVNNNKLKVVGYYKSKYDLNYYYSNLDTIKYKLITQSTNIIICPKDKISTLTYFNTNNENIEDTYETTRQNYINKMKQSIISNLVVATIIIIISLVEIYLMMRSSFISRVKEVGILRAIGVKKRDIYKMFLGEILAISFTTGIIGISLMSYLLMGLTKVSYFKDNLMFNSNIVLLSAAIFLIFNIIIGLLPVHHTIKKTPAQILSSNNID